jgi:hypothetical protein
MSISSQSSQPFGSGTNPAARMKSADTLFSSAEHCVHGMKVSVRRGVGEQAGDEGGLAIMDGLER